MPLFGRSWIMHTCHADASCHFGVTRTLTLLLVGRYESLHQMLGTTLPRVSGTKTLSPNNYLAYTPDPLTQQPWIIRQCLLRWVPADHSSRKFSQPPFHGPLQPTGGHVRCCHRGIYSSRNRQNVGEPLYSLLGMPIDSPIR